jgi:hypothetical protein
MPVPAAVCATVAAGVVALRDDVDQPVAHHKVDMVAVRDGVRVGAQQKRARLGGGGGQAYRV